MYRKPLISGLSAGALSLLAAAAFAQSPASPTPPPPLGGPSLRPATPPNAGVPGTAPGAPRGPVNTGGPSGTPASASPAPAASARPALTAQQPSPGAVPPGMKPFPGMPARVAARAGTASRPAGAPQPPSSATTQGQGISVNALRGQMIYNATGTVLGTITDIRIVPPGMVAVVVNNKAGQTQVLPMGALQTRLTAVLPQQGSPQSPPRK